MNRVIIAPLLLAALSLFTLGAADKGVTLKAKEGVATSASGGQRIALVIGNSAYRYSGALANPARDAELMATTLQKVGFELVGGGAQVDLGRSALDRSIETFGDRLREGDTALFSYSGHGLQVGGENYLVPIDADIKKEAEVRVKTVPVNLLFAKLDGIPKTVNIVILDACRNNPFARSFRSSGSGLASVSAPTGTLVAFSTAPGQVAEDGERKNSTYTAALAKYIREPGLSVEDVFKRVRSEVTGRTKGTQTPWENTSLTGNFAFIEGDALALKKAALAAAGDARKGELDDLLKLEAEAKRQQEKEQAEIAKREAEVAKLDAEIAAMKQRLGTGSTSGNGSLKSMVVVVGQREAQAKKLTALRQQREAEEARLQAEIARLKDAENSKRRAAVEADIADYEAIVHSPYGKDLAVAAWQSLAGKYPAAEKLEVGDLSSLRQSFGIRFVDNGNGTVEDLKTGLVWLKSVNCFDGMDWDNAMSKAKQLASGVCGLRDETRPGQWRLPSQKELELLVDNFRQASDDYDFNKFIGVQVGLYWTSDFDNDFSRVVYFPENFIESRKRLETEKTRLNLSKIQTNGPVRIIPEDIGGSLKSAKSYFWPVRGGQ